VWSALNTRTRSASGLEENLARTAEKVLEIADKYFRYPLKVLKFSVPFSEPDMLKIRFRSPAVIKYGVTYSPYARDRCKAIVVADTVCCSVKELSIEFVNGTVGNAEAVDADGRSYALKLPPTSTTLFFAALFAQNAFEKIAEAEVSSVHGLASKWFAELIEAYEELSNRIDMIKIEDLFDYTKAIGRVDLHIRLDNVGAVFVLSRGVDILSIELYAIVHLLSYRLGTLLYSPRLNEVISGDIVVEKFISKFPVKVLNDIDEFLKKLFITYITLAASIRYVLHTF